MRMLYLTSCQCLTCHHYINIRHYLYLTPFLPRTCDPKFKKGTWRPQALLGSIKPSPNNSCVQPNKADNHSAVARTNWTTQLRTRAHSKIAPSPNSPEPSASPPRLLLSRDVAVVITYSIHNQKNDKRMQSAYRLRQHKRQCVVFLCTWAVLLMVDARLVLGGRTLHPPLFYNAIIPPLTLSLSLRLNSQAKQEQHRSHACKVQMFLLCWG